MFFFFEECIKLLDLNIYIIFTRCVLFSSTNLLPLGERDEEVLFISSLLYIMSSSWFVLKRMQIYLPHCPTTFTRLNGGFLFASGQDFGPP